MATRQTNPRPARAPRALREGATVSTVAPGTVLRLGRHLRLVSPDRETTSVVTNGALVLGESRAVARPKLQVGSIVTVECNRRTRIHAFDLGGLNPSGTEFLRRSVPSELRVVTAVSASGKFFRATTMATPRAYDAVFRPVDGVWTLKRHTARRYEPAANEGRGGYVTTEPLPTANDWGACASGLVCLTERTPQYHTEYDPLFRASHIKAHIPVEAIDPRLFDAARAAVRDQVAHAMWVRLAEQEALRRPDAPSRSQRYYRPEARAERRQMGRSSTSKLRRAAEMFRSARAEDMEGAGAYLKTAAAQLGRLSIRCDPTAWTNRWLERNGLGHLHYAAGCGHFHAGPSVPLIRDNYMGVGEFCPVCAEAATPAVMRDGTMGRVRTGSVNIYTWSDGTVRVYREPPIIGGRHSGKGIVGLVPPLSGLAAGKYLTLGLELEMQAYGGADRESLAHQMKARLAAANLLDARGMTKYLHFEEDGSIGAGGVEMVTGYTDVATHAALLKALLADEAGRPAWRGKLRSHDASSQSCGIHVHVQKPASLIHASKMRYFINSPLSQKLVSDVARRYNTRWASVDHAAAGGTDPLKLAAAEVKACKRGDKADKGSVRDALSRLSTTRYQALNFQNSATVEFRIFRGSMVYESVMACIEFSQAVWQYTRYTCAAQLSPNGFIAFISEPDNRKETANLRAYLTKKGWSPYMAKPRKVPGETASATATPRALGEMLADATYETA